MHCKSVPAQETRALLTARKLLQTKHLDVEMSLRGVLRGFGLSQQLLDTMAYDALPPESDRAVRQRRLAARVLASYIDGRTDRSTYDP